MTETLPVSVVVVSRGRPQALARCLLGLSQLRYAPFEVIVVADPGGVAAAEALPFSDHLKIVAFDRPNISEARNLGISHGSGEVVAFIDDDAVPEPSWLMHLIAPFAKPEVAASGGFVRGRNGISFQYTAQSVDAAGRTEPFDIAQDRATVLAPKGRRAIKTEGTNMAVRREVLVALEGFDPGFAFFLDETDVNLRLAKAGHATALVPLAEVHHGYAASARRRQDRAPRDLFEIGASWAVFARKHLPEATQRKHWREIRGKERLRLVQHMVAGRLEPRDVRRLMRRLDEGHAAGLTRARGGAEISKTGAMAFRQMPAATGTSRVFAGRIWQKGKLRRAAAKAVASGDIATVICLSPTAMFHRVRFIDAGHWEQTGGLFGRSERKGPIFKLNRFSKRIAAETKRVYLQRLLTKI